MSRIAHFLLAAGVFFTALISAGTKATAADDKKTTVLIETSMGRIVVELDQEKAPITVKNFLTYMDAKHYDNLIFHRVIPNFMVQCGGMDKSMNEKPTMSPIVNEASNGLTNKRGTLAMARTNNPNSATSQFFINVKDNEFLNKKDGSAGYAVFGKVVQGMDIVDKIVAVKTHSVGQHEDVPVEPIFIKSVRRQTAP